MHGKLEVLNRWGASTLRGQLGKQLNDIVFRRNDRIFINKVEDSQLKDLRNTTHLQNDSGTTSGRNSLPQSQVTALIAVKDNVTTQHLKTTCASAVLEGYGAPEDATIVRLLRQAGVATIAKTNLDEFGMGSHNLHSRKGPLYNGKGLEAISVGGSSGGSAMAIAANLFDFAIGTDTGGSVRLPAAYTSLVGFKPSYGLISRNGIVPYANSLDTVGILASNIMNVYLLFKILNREDSRDPTCLKPRSRKRMPWLQAELATRRLEESMHWNRVYRENTDREEGRHLVEEATKDHDSILNEIKLTQVPGNDDVAERSPEEAVSDEEDLDTRLDYEPITTEEASLSDNLHASLLSNGHIGTTATAVSVKIEHPGPIPEATQTSEFEDPDLVDATPEYTKTPTLEALEDTSFSAAFNGDTVTTDNPESSGIHVSDPLFDSMETTQASAVPFQDSTETVTDEYVPQHLRTTYRRRKYYQVYDPWLFDQYTTTVGGEPREKFRIGVPVEYNIEELHPDVRRAWVRTLTHLQLLGNEIVPISLPSTKQALSAYYVIAPAEASSNLAKYDGVRYGAKRSEEDATSGNVLYATFRGKHFGDEVKRRILLGAYTLSAGAMENYFIQAQKVRRLVQEDFNMVFRRTHPLIGGSQGMDNGIDYIVCPTAPTPPPQVDKILGQASPPQSYINDVFTVPASLAGLPAMSVPTIANVRLPTTPDSAIGMQIIGQYGDDLGVMTFAQGYFERYQDWDGIPRVQNVKKTYNKEMRQWWAPEEHWKRNPDYVRKDVRTRPF